MQTLVFQLHGPLMSFGITGGDKKRPTRVRPTRSAVLGLLMGAMGIDRSDVESQQRVSEGLKMSALTYSEGRIEDDFHTVRAPREGGHATRRDEVAQIESQPSRHEGATIMTERSYVSDTYCQVALSLESGSDFSVRDAAESLRQPAFLPYAGRRAFALGLPLNPKIEDGLSLDVFRDFPVSDPAEKVINNIDGIRSLSTELPDNFEFEFRPITVRDRRLPGTRQFRNRKEWVTEVEDDVL